jgi:hypothetical protein
MASILRKALTGILNITTWMQGELQDVYVTSQVLIQDQLKAYLRSKTLTHDYLQLYLRSKP